MSCKKNLIQRITASAMAAVLLLAGAFPASAATFDFSSLTGENPGVIISDSSSAQTDFDVPSEVPSEASGDNDNAPSNTGEKESSENGKEVSNETSVEEEKETSTESAEEMVEDLSSKNKSFSVTAKVEKMIIDENGALVLANSPQAYGFNGISRASFGEGDSKTVNVNAHYELAYCFWGQASNPMYGEYFPVITVGGELAYCMEPNVLIGDQLNYSATLTWSGLSSTQQETILKILRAGTTSTSDTAGVLATQCLIWEVVQGVSVGNANNYVYNGTVASHQSWAGGTITPPSAAVTKYASIWSAAQSGSGGDSALLFWINPGKQTIVTLNDGSDEPFVPEIPDVEEGEAIGQITIVKKDDEGRSLDGAIFKVEVKFSDGSTYSNSAFEVTDGSRLFTWKHPKGNTDVAKVTVTEVQAPAGYELDPTPKTADVTPTTLIDGTMSVGDLHVTVTFVNKEAEATIIIYKYQKGNSGIPLAGAQFEISYVDPSVHSGRWTVTTGINGKATISLPKAGAILIRETKAPEGYVITVDELTGASKTDTVVTIAKGETKQVDIPNDKKGAVNIVKKDNQDGRVLAGAVFRITNVVTGDYKEGTTGSNGVVTFTDLVPGAYRVEETNAPQYYELSGVVKTVEILEGSNETITLEFRNEPWTGLRIVKVDSKTAARLEGGIFDLYRGADLNAEGMPQGEFLSSYQTNTNGEILLRNLQPGYYTVVERQAPYGYAVDQTNAIRVVQISPDDPNRELQVIYQNDELPKLKIIKRDKDTGIVLEGAVFKLRHEDGAEYTDLITDANGEVLIERLPIGWYTITEIRQPSGYLMPLNPELPPVQLVVGETTEVVVFNQAKPSLTIKKIDSKTKAGLPNATFKITKQGAAEYTTVTTGNSGTAKLTGLEAGWYIVEEIYAPPGYILNSKPYTIELKPNEDAVITIENEIYPSLKIKKIDNLTKEPLQFAEFTIKKPDGTVVFTGITNEYGEIFLPEIEAGNYTLIETGVPDGYTAITIEQDIVIHAGENLVVTVPNNAIDPLYIQKIDSVTQKALAGAVFKVENVTGEYIGEYRTGSNGYATATGLKTGYYIVTEIKAPNGYILSASPKTVRIANGQPATVTFENTPKAGLQIIKLDSVSGVPLEGVTFKVTHADGKTVGTYKTGVGGIIQIDNLEPGAYTFIETATVEGYVLDSTPQTVTVEEGKVTTVEVKNQAKSALHILKVDKTTNKPLAGAKFKLETVGGEYFGEYTTNSSGYITIPNLNPGYFVITEIKAPDGFIITDSPRTIKIEANKPLTVTIDNTPLNGLEIIKVDSETGEPLEGVTFKVSKANGEQIGYFITGEGGLIQIPNLESGTYTVVETDTIPGYILDDSPISVTLVTGKAAIVRVKNTPKSPMFLQKIDSITLKPLSGAKFRVETIDGGFIGEYTTGASGLATVPSLEPGYYNITEIKAPDGYLISDSPKTVKVVDGVPMTVTIENTKLNGLNILKVDSKTKEPLIGAKFKIAKSNGEYVGEYKTEAGGLIQIPNLEPGAYVIVETETIEGYILDSTPKTVELKKGATISVEFQNEPKAGLQIRKIDLTTGQPLMGVEFEVRRPNGEMVGVFKTSETGTIFIENLTPGTYVITELTALSGYKPDYAPRTVDVKSGELLTTTYKNAKYPMLTLKKVDSETGRPLAGAKLKLMDSSYRELGVVTTTELGIINVTGLEQGTYFVQEIAAPSGYVLDSTAREVQLLWGKTTVIEIKNTPKGTLRIQKVDAVTGKPLYGATFNLYDSKNNLLGEYTSDNTGMIVFKSELTAGTYKLKEVKSPAGYVLNDTPITITLKAGETTEITLKNEPEVGNIQIVKVAADENSLTKDKKGDVLKGAVFEIYDEELDVVDRITTDSRGIAKSKDLPLGKYAIKEIEAPQYYYTDGKPFYAQIKIHNDLVRFEVENEPVDISVTVQKRGHLEALAGQPISWEFYGIENTSNIPLNDFYWHDLIPSDAVRVMSMTTGVWSERVTYTAYYRTNLNDSYRVLKSDLLSTSNHELSLTSASLGLKINEFVTDTKLVFGKVEPGFHETTRPIITAVVMPNLPDGYSIVNRTDVGGRNGEEWTYSKDSWVTITLALPRGSLPKTGY